MSLFKYSAPLFAALLLAGCGGGSDDPVVATVAPEQSPVGLWEGTVTITSGIAATRGVLAAIAPDGEYTATIAATTGLMDGRLLRGTGTITSRNQFNAGGTAFSASFPAGGTSAPITITGTVTTGSTITGTYSAGGETGTLSLTYRSLTNNPSSLTAASGTFSAIAGSNTQPGAVTIATNGAITWNSTACTGNGMLSTIDTTKNIYRWSMDVFQNAGACTLAGGTALQGLAWLAPAGALDNQVLVMHGTRSNAGYVFLGQR